MSMPSQHQGLRRLGVHLATAAGALALTRLAWATGGILSPQMGGLLVLPLVPLCFLGHRAGLVWLGLVGLLQAALALLSHSGWGPPVASGPETALSSWWVFTWGVCAVLVLAGLTERRHHLALQQCRHQLRGLRAQRRALGMALHARGQFTAAVGHGLRTPMQTILGFNALLLSRAKDRPQALKVLEHTRQSAEHLMTVINDLYDHVQLQAGQLDIRPDTFDLRRAAQQAFEIFTPRVNGQGLDYRIEWDPMLPAWVHTDRHRLIQVLVNLLGNALKFTPQGSVVLRVQWENPGVLFSVQDTGIGIPHARQREIFKRFTQAEADTQARYGGHGLGLAISHQLAHALGGTIGFESEPGQGSCFCLRLPLTAVPAPALQPGTYPRVSPTAQTAWCFLVVDDHPLHRLLLKQVLLEAWPHCTVLEASNGQQALDVLHTQAVDLVLMDMVMPVMDGIAATAALRTNADARRSALPVLGLTANVNPQALERFKAAGLSGVLLKPFERSLLCAQIEVLVAGGSGSVAKDV